jgi:Ca-activated chloride channel family protein
MTHRLTGAVLLLGFLGSSPARRAETVPIYVTVLDHDGHLVSNLTQEDFEILDNGRPAQVEIFKSGIQPMTVVVMLDTSGSMTLNLTRLQQAAESFVIQLKPGDRARIGEFNDDVRLSRTFTGDRDALLRILHDDFKYGNGTKLWDAIDVSMTALSPETGRRVLLVFTDGEDTTSKTSYDSVLKRALREDYLVYAVGLRSLMAGMGETAPDRRLKSLASETGGRYFELTQAADLRTTFTSVADELHGQYVLGVTAAALDGKSHKIDVKVKRPGVTVVARRRYIASAR